MKLEILPGTTLMVNPGIISHQGSANHSPTPWPGAKVVVVLLALEQVSACPWTQAHSVFPLGGMGRGAEWVAVLGTWPGGLAEMECPWPALCEQSEMVRR